MLLASLRDKLAVNHSLRTPVFSDLDCKNLNLLTCCAHLNSQLMLGMMELMIYSLSLL